MNIYLKRTGRQQGSVLVVALLLAVIMGITLGAYLSMLTQQRITVTRSQAWNLAMGYAEAGVEEAMSQLNPGAAATNVDRTANGWGLPSGGRYGPMSRNLTNGAYTVYYTTDSCPIIYSTGTVSVAAIPATLTRTVRVMTTNSYLFSVGMASLTGINFNGSGVNINSFNSQNPNQSSNGLYVASMASTNGSIASMGGVIGVNNGTVNGNVYLGPNVTDSLKANGTVTGSVNTDFNYNFPDVVLPQTTWLPFSASVPQVINGVTYGTVFTVSGDYQVSSVSGNIYVSPGVHVRLYVTGSSSVSTVRIGTSPMLGTGTMQFFMGGPSFTLSGQDAVDSGYAIDFQYYGLPSNTSVSFTGNSAFTGTIYAPEAAFTLGGGGNNTYDFVGACVTKSVTMNGHYNFHFDESLATGGPTGGYVAWSWQEL